MNTKRSATITAGGERSRRRGRAAPGSGWAISRSLLTRKGAGAPSRVAGDARVLLLALALFCSATTTLHAQDTEPVDEQAAEQLEAIGETARERVGEAAEAVGEGVRGLFGAARNRIGAAAREGAERVREVVTGQPRRREEAVVRGMIAIAPANAAANEAQVDAMAQQLRPYLRAELYLVREVCDISDDQYRQLAEAGDAALRDVARPLAGNGVVLRSDNPSAGPDELIQKELAGALDEFLSAEQLAAYQTEFDARTEDRKQVAIRNLVAFIDQKVLLSDDQREAMAQSFEENWDESWYRALELFRFGDQYLPKLPDHCILPVLDETQKQIWQARMQGTQTIHFGGLVTQPVENDALETPNPVENNASSDQVNDNG